MPIDYSKWDNLELSSEDSDDCHPNIDLGSWKRMKGRMRNEKGLPPRPTNTLKDKWNYTKVNKTEDTTEKDAGIEFDKSDIHWSADNKLLIDEYAETANKWTAYQLIKDNPRLASSVIEGIMITRSVDLACEISADHKRVETMVRNTLHIYNIVKSATAAKMRPDRSVPHFFSRLENPKVRKEYDREFESQVHELKDRVATRRIARLKEEAERMEEEKAPIGPGGLDPTDVLNSLPKDMQDAFQNQNIEKLQAAIKSLPTDQASYHLKRCVDSGLWVPNDPSAILVDRPPEAKDAEKDTPEPDDADEDMSPAVSTDAPTGASTATETTTEAEQPSLPEQS